MGVIPLMAKNVYCKLRVFLETTPSFGIVIDVF